MKKQLTTIILSVTMYAISTPCLASDFNSIDPNSLSKEELVIAYNELLSAYNALTDAYMDELINNIVGASETEAETALSYAIFNSISMENTIASGDMVYYSETAYDTADPQRQDIIIFRPILYFDSYFIQRIIGLPGETVEIREGEIYIDGSSMPLKEDYLKEEWIVLNDGFTFEVPENCYLMLGDNRNNCSDSRYWASEAFHRGLTDSLEDATPYSFLPRENIVGKVILN